MKTRPFLKWMSLGCLLFTSAANSAPPLPPRIESTHPSAPRLPWRASSELFVTASDPQGSPLSFTWTATDGSLSPPIHGPDSSQIVWTAPDCLPPQSAPVKVVVTNAQGLTTEAAFTFEVSNLHLNHQQPFALPQFSDLRDVTVSAGATLRLAPTPTTLNAERIIFEEPVFLSLQLVRTSADAGHTLGWMYHDELVARGYVGANDVLLDSNRNGIADLHEDLYNLAPTAGAQARPYIGLSRRCSRPFTSGGLMYSTPDLGMDSSCQSAFRRENVADPRPGRAGTLYPSDIVGKLYGTYSSIHHSDRGRFPYIPNLLEPAVAENNFKGLGRLPVLITDDDTDFNTFLMMGPVSDTRTAAPDGILDYDVSAYTPQGLPNPLNPDPGITLRDRRVTVGAIDGQREVIFFLVTYNPSVHSPASSGVTFPCLKRSTSGQCTLFLQTPISVFFSKSAWNLDIDTRGTVAEFHQGCAYRDVCDHAYPEGGGACTLPGSTQQRCGWLDATAQAQLARPDYGAITLPDAPLRVPPSSHGATPHLAVASSPDHPNRWLLGWEDLNGGGDRDFSDVVFLLQTDPSGLARTAPLPGMHPDLDPRCTFSRVRVARQELTGPICSPTSEASTRYAIASDCEICTAGLCFPNPTPTWIQVPLADGASEAVVDVSPFGGRSLCWQASLNTRDFLCQPEVLQVDIGFEMTRSP
ncbi:DUF4114 domain-containing protein [Myxococcus sp. K38C18041901]|uniref:DUF4114 domain-containing protein n=1 Tax=Myxococcus guangdongensis TaxID=2906760 RepID=UPI0020A7341C|nr:DUF4114 domain-containing protein [Myxococcus guangdongensis]MCP3064932.1 DUF4114 domain-containing protein [Myxococcus guangdongensis]